MQSGDDAVHLRVDRGALARLHARQSLIPEYAAFHVLHDVKRGADDRFNLAQREAARDRYPRSIERGYHAILPIHRVRRRQQLARWLAPQHITRGRCNEQKGRIGLAAFELLHLQRAGITRHFRTQVGTQRLRIEAVSFLYGHGADEIVVHERCSFSRRKASSIPSGITFSQRGIGYNSRSSHEGSPCKSSKTRWRSSPVAQADWGSQWRDASRARA